jgi:hypothetical protein
MVGKNSDLTVFILIKLHKTGTVGRGIENTLYTRRHGG